MIAGEPTSTVGGQDAVHHHPPEEISNTERDPNKMNQHLRLVFQDIIAEPEPGIYSFDGVWQCSYKTFTATKLWCYRIITLLCACPVSFCLGIQFACLSFNYIWCWMPYLRAFEIYMSFIRKIYTALMNAFCLPYFNALGYVFSKIRVTMAQGSPPNYVELDV